MTALRGRTRWSAACRCPRWAVLALQGAEPAPPTLAQQGYWARGKAMGQFVADKYAAAFGADKVIREKAVPWPAEGLPLGELHTDVFLVDDGRAVEVKSTDYAGSLIESALTQLAGQVHWDPDADHGLLHIISPSNWASEELLPFTLTPEWVAKVEQIAETIREAARSKVLPPCTQSNPAACHAFGCPFTNVAWEDWQPPTPGVVNGEMALLVTELYHARKRERAAKGQLEYVESARKQLEERLVDLGAGEYRAGPLLLKVTVAKGRESFSLAKARATGAWRDADDERFGPFVKISEPSRRLAVSRESTEPLVEDFGEDVPF